MLIQNTPREITIEMPHCTLAAKIWGSDTCLPTIGLHGWLDNANTFDSLAPLLPGVQLLSLDLAGHGKSDHRPDGMRYHYTDYVDEVIGVANALGWNQFIILGHSMGAGVGCLAASAFPERIKQLILVEGLGAVTNASENIPNALKRSITAMAENEKKTPPVYQDLEQLIQTRAAVSKIDYASAAALISRGVYNVGTGYTWRSDQRLKIPNPQYFTDELMIAFLKGIKAPTLLITAENGTLRKRPYFQSRCKAIENLQICQLPGNHHLHLEHPRLVADSILKFIRS